MAGEVQGTEREQMERHFFAAPARREKLRIAAALKERQQKNRKRWLPSPELRIAASILIIAGLAFGIWFALRSSGESELDKGLAALQTAYAGERPIEARVSELPYSSYSQTRGTNNNEQRADNLRRAELHLTQAVKDKPDSEADHALGKVYLAQGRSDDAIKELEQSLRNSRNQAQIYNDLGVAWLQKGDYNRSVDNFNKALQLDANLHEALFNRALAYEKQSRSNEAKADWSKYLKRDSTSDWAVEARRHLGAP